MRSCQQFFDLELFINKVVTKTQILIKVSFCIFHDANHNTYQNDQKQVKLEPFEHHFHLMA